MRNHIQNLINLDLLDGKGFALDLGCGDGKDSLEFSKLGYNVVSVDKKTNFGIACDVRDFNIEYNKYSFINCNNVLPFIKNLEEVSNLLHGMAKGLIDGGILHFTLFGNKTDFAKEYPDTMSFFTYEEASKMADSLNLSLVEKSTVEGYHKSMMVVMKYWEIHVIDRNKMIPKL